MKRNLIILAIAVIAIAGVWIWDESGRGASSGQAAGAAGQSVGEIPADPAPKANHFAPAFTLDSLDGTTSYSVGGSGTKL